MQTDAALPRRQRAGARASRTAAGRVGGVTYVTLNVQGSCNNLCDTAPDPAEFAARNHGEHRLAAATRSPTPEHGSAAIMIIAQADPGWDLSDPTRAPLRDPKTLAETDGQPDGFQEFLLALRDEVIAFRKPVAYVHGDSHYFRVDKPFLDALGRRLENFTRVETFGDNQGNGNNDVHWLKVLVDPRSREVFTLPAADRPGKPDRRSGALRFGTASVFPRQRFH